MLKKLFLKNSLVLYLYKTNNECIIIEFMIEKQLIDLL